jgi:hypothetical protein
MASLRRTATGSGSNPDRSLSMSDLIYLALGAAGFLVFALAVRAADRM